MTKSITRTTFVYPTNKHNISYPMKDIPLSGVDFIVGPLNMVGTWHYAPPPPGESIDALVNRLKNALAEALELYPPLTGTVRVDDNGMRFIALEGEESRPGTPFIFEKKREPYSIGEDPRDTLPRESTTILDPTASAFAVKVTEYACGTIAIGISVHHQVGDACSIHQFTQLWMQIARGEPVDYKTITSDFTRNPEKFFSFLKDQDQPRFSPPVFPVEKSMPDMTVYERFFRPCVGTMWRVSKASGMQLIKDLSLASSPEISDEQFTLHESLSALVFGALTRARANFPRGPERSSEDTETESITMPVNARAKVLPDGKGGKRVIDRRDYFGNMITLSKTHVSRKDVLSPTIEATARVAHAIQESLLFDMSPKGLLHQIHFTQEHRITDPLERFSAQSDVFVSNCSKYDFTGDSNDFGWGKAFQFQPGFGNTAVPGYVFISLNRETMNSYVWIGVDLDEEQTLKSDPLLNRYCSLLKTVVQYPREADSLPIVADSRL